MKLLKFLFLLLLITTTSCAYDEDDKIESTPHIGTQEIISPDSDLFQNLTAITKDETRPNQSIACIDFIYPVTLFVFNDNDEYVSTTLINNDEQFSTFLDEVDLEFNISISFPITSTLEAGGEIIINNKEELKNAIDSCKNEELISECAQILRSCVWKVGYSYNYDNTYLGGIFIETDGYTTFQFNDDQFTGSWTTFFIENELHINISLNEADETGTFFNFDWKVQFLDENTLLLTNQESELVLNQRCDTDFDVCNNFIFEVCETAPDSGISEYILDEFTYCIFDTLELDDTLDITYYETEEDALAMTNPIPSNEEYINTENEQNIYVRIDDLENGQEYFAVITLTSINC